MSNEEIADILSGMSPALKKELLERLTGALLNELGEKEKTALFQTVLKGRGKTPPVIDMVER